MLGVSLLSRVSVSLFHTCLGAALASVGLSAEPGGLLRVAACVSPTVTVLVLLIHSSVKSSLLNHLLWLPPAYWRVQIPHLGSKVQCVIIWWLHQTDVLIEMIMVSQHVVQSKAERSTGILHLVIPSATLCKMMCFITRRPLTWVPLTVSFRGPPRTRAPVYRGVVCVCVPFCVDFWVYPCSRHAAAPSPGPLLLSFHRHTLLLHSPSSPIWPLIPGNH